MRNDSDLDAGPVQGFLLAMPVCMVVLGNSVMLPIIPTLQRVFSSQPRVEILTLVSVVLPILALALTGPIAGALGDRVGRRRVLNLSALVFAIFAIMPLVLDNLWLFIASRGVTGVALGCMMTSAIALTGDYFAGSTRQRWLGFQGAASAFTGVIAAAASGALAEIHWRLPFLMLAAGFPLFLALVVFPGPSTTTPSEAMPEAVAAAPGDQRWATFAIIFLLGVLASLVMFPPAYAIGIVLEQKALGSSMLAGLTLAVLAAGGVAGAMGLNLLRRFSPAVRQCIAFGVAAAGTLAIWVANGLPAMFIGAVAVGVGQGMTMPNLSAWMLDRAPLQARGQVTGVFQMTYFLAQFASPLLAQWVAKMVGGATASMFYYAVAGALLVPLIGIAAAGRPKLVPNIGAGRL